MAPHFAAGLALALLLAPLAPQEVTVNPCTLHVQPGEADWVARVTAAPAGAVVCLAPGDYVGKLAPTHSVTLRGTGGAAHTTLRSGGGPLLVVRRSGRFVIEGVTIRGSGSPAFGAIAVDDAEAEVLLSDCRFRGNSGGRSDGPPAGPSIGPGALSIHAARTVDIERCVFEHNRGHRGGAIYLKSGRLAVRNSVFERNRAFRGGAVCIEGSFAAFECTGCTFIANTALTGAEIFDSGRPQLAAYKVRLVNTLFADTAAAALHTPHAPAELVHVAIPEAAAPAPPAGHAEHLTRTATELDRDYRPSAAPRGTPSALRTETFWKRVTR
jgi:hypothetical protein